MSTATALVWQQLPGLAHEVALGADGSAWCLGTGGSSNGGRTIHRWNGSNWDHIHGAADRIAVSPFGEVWILNREQAVLRNSGAGWVGTPGRAREIAIGANGTTWCISASDFAPGGGSLHVWNGHDWNHVDGGAAVKIAVDPEGLPWIINSAGHVFRRSGEGWELLPGLARELAIGVDGRVWCLCRTADPAVDSSIHLWNGTDWDHVPGAAVKISAGLPGSLLIANAAHELLRSVPMT